MKNLIHQGVRVFFFRMSNRRAQLNAKANEVAHNQRSAKDAAFKAAMMIINKQLDQAATQGLFSCVICAELPLRQGYEEHGSYSLDAAEFITMQNTLIGEGFQVVGSDEMGEKYKKCWVKW